ncbi:MAG: S9 family peptidase [Bacteroidales bacterium]|nr:S9 family peptidase [Bacteroidales bacterium]
MKHFRKLCLLLFITSLAINIVAQPHTEKQDKINLEDIWLNYKYYPKTVRGYNPMNDGVSYTIISQGHIDLYSYKTGKMIKTLVEATEFIPKGESKPLKFNSYEFSGDETKILFPTNIESIYRHSFKADYWIYDMEKKELKMLSTKGPQQLATFSPDGNKVAFVRENNLYYVDLISGAENQITTDGEKNRIINGAPDWVYEEEFSFSKAFEWSPMGDKIAFIRFDESAVRQFELTTYGNLYPDKVKYKYPKTGEANSVVEVHIFDLVSNNNINVDLGSEKDIYIPRISWTTKPGVLSIQRLNRLQNHLEILVTDAGSGMTNVVYSEKNPYYIDITDNLTWLEDGKGFILTSEKDGYNHIYHFDAQGAQLAQLTKGNFDVIEVEGFDEKTGWIYYIAAESSPMNRDIFRVNVKSSKIEKLSSREGTNSPQFSTGFKYFVNTFTTIDTPPFITVNSQDGKEIQVLQDNAGMLALMKENNFLPSKFFNFQTENGDKLNGWMIKPLNFDSTKRYPVLMYVYGGPGSQTVLNSWGWFNYVWFQMMAQKGYVVVSVDGRGTGARGQEFKKCTYLKLGELETVDQIEAAKFLGKKSWIDADRIGIFGWSYGGYMSSLCMTVGANYFKTGIAVAPVTNWRHYDNIYTERFMRTPQENGSNYDKNSPVTHAEKMKGKFLLVHGTSDDNVHVENSMDFVNALVNANKQFEMQFYPNNDHGIAGGRYTRYHLFTRMTDFLLINL